MTGIGDPSRHLGETDGVLRRRAGAQCRGMPTSRPSASSAVRVTTDFGDETVDDSQSTVKRTANSAVKLTAVRSAAAMKRRGEA